MITKEEFKKGYCDRSKITLEKYDKHFVALPCGCDCDGCEGWATISNDPQSIKGHMRFNAPVEEVKDAINA